MKAKILFNIARIAEAQKQLNTLFSTHGLPVFNLFIEKGKTDEVFQLYSSFVSNLLPYVYGYLSIRKNDFGNQKLVAKMMFERIFVSQQSLYKQILREI